MNEAGVLMRILPAFLRKRIEGRQDLQKILGNTSWLFADRVLRMGVGLLVGVWVARYLGPAQFGIMNYGGAFIALFSAVSCLGLEGIVVREFVRLPSERDEILGTVFAMKLVASIVTMAVAACAINFVRSGEPLTHLIVYILAAGSVFQAFDVIDYFFQSIVAAKYTVWSKNLAFLLMAVVRVYLVMVKAPLVAFAFAAAGEAVLGGLGLLLVYKWKGNAILAWKTSRARGAKLLHSSWPLILSGLSVIVYMRIDQVMLGSMMGNKPVGIYSAAVRISEIWYFIPSAICSSAFPSIIEAKAADEGLYYRRIQRLLNLMTGLSLSLAIPMTFLSSYVIGIVFGEGYAAAGSVLSVHIWTAVFVFLGFAQGSWDVTENLTKLSLFRTASGALINILLNLVLIPQFAVLGAALATVISQACSAVLLNALFQKTRPMFYCQIKSLLFWRVV